MKEFNSFISSRIVREDEIVFESFRAFRNPFFNRFKVECGEDFIAIRHRDKVLRSERRGIISCGGIIKKFLSGGYNCWLTDDDKFIIDGLCLFFRNFMLKLISNGKNGAA